MSLGEAVVDIKADTSQLGPDLKGKLKSIGGTAAKALAVGTGAAVGFGAAIGAAAFKVGQTSDTLLDLSAITGASVEKLQEMRYVASQAGTNTDFFSNSVSQLNRYMTDIEKGTGKQAEALDRLGVATRGANGEMLSAQEITDQAIQKLAGITDESLRAQLATDIFSRKANDLIPVLALGSDEIERMRGEAHELGAVMNEDAVNAANNYRMKIEQLQATASGLANKALAALTPMLTDLADFAQDKLVPAANNLIDRFTALWATYSEGEDFVDGLMKVLGELTSGRGIGSIFDKLRSMAESAFNNLVNWLATGGLGQILNALLAGRQRLLDAALQLFPAILDALILFVPQLLEFITGSLIPAIIQILLEGIPLLLETAVSVFTTLVEGVQTVLPALLETLLGEVLPQLLVTLLGMVPDILNAGLNVFNQLIQAVTTILPQLLTTLLTVVLPQVIRTLLGMIPQLIQTGITVFKSLITAVLEVLPDLLSTLLGTVLPDVIVTLINMIPELLDTAIEVFTALVDGIIEVIPDIANAIIFDVIPAIVTAIIEGVPKILGAAKDLLGGMITGIKEKAGEVIEAMKKWVLDKIPGFVKDFFGIASPSKMFTEFGHNIVDGLVKGITSSSGDVDDAIGRLAGNASGRLAGLAADISPAITSATGGPTGGGVSIGNLTIDLDITFTGPVTEAKAREAGQAAADAAIERLSRARLVH